MLSSTRITADGAGGENDKTDIAGCANHARDLLYKLRHRNSDLASLCWPVLQWRTRPGQHKKAEALTDPANVPGIYRYFCQAFGDSFLTHLIPLPR